MKALLRPLVVLLPLLAAIAVTAQAQEPPRFRWYPTYFASHSAQHGKIGTHEGRAWRYVDGQTHGFPYSLSDYEPRAVGASYTFGYWAPYRSHYFPYVLNQTPGPYGFSPEPYYCQQDVPVRNPRRAARQGHAVPR